MKCFLKKHNLPEYVPRLNLYLHLSLATPKHQKSRIQRKLFFQSSPQDPHEACYVVLSGGESCPVRAKTHHSDSQSLVCS